MFILFKGHRNPVMCLSPYRLAFREGRGGVTADVVHSVDLTLENLSCVNHLAGGAFARGVVTADALHSANRTLKTSHVSITLLVLLTGH